MPSVAARRRRGAILLALLIWLTACQAELTREEAAGMAEPPPRGVVATVVADGVELTWRGRSPDVACFEVERAASGSEPEPLACIRIGDSLGPQQFVDASPPPGEVTYRVRARNLFGTVSEPIEASVTVGDR
jgi:hypothetical protein